MAGLERPSGFRRERRGYVLIAVLIVIVVLSLAAYRYSDMMIAEYRATDRILKNVEAKALADSGVHYAAALLADKSAMAQVGNPYNSEAYFRDKSPDAEGRRGRFSIVSFDYSQEASSGTVTSRYGVADESGRLNVNALVRLDPSPNGIAYRALMGLQPLGMTDAIAYAIIDWIDADANTSPDGAEDEYYMSRSPAFHCKNGPLDSVDELLLIKGVTPALLFGNDLNRNGQRDPDEETGGDFSYGWAPYITVFSRELNVDIDGNPRINLNGSDIKKLYTDLKTAVGADLAAYLVAYRIYDQAPTSTQPNQIVIGGTTALLVEMVEAAVNGGQARSRRNVSSIMQLIGSRVSTRMTTNNQGPQATVVFSFPITDASQARDILPKVLDKTTTQSDRELPGRVNVATAPREVLSCLPGLEPADVDLIIEHRPAPESADAADPIYQTPAWLYTEANLTPAKLQALEQYITSRTQVYRIQSVGYFDKAGPVVRVEAVIDTNQGKPRILYYRDLTELGRAVDPRNN